MFWHSAIFSLSFYNVLVINLQTTSCLISPWRNQKLGPELGFHIVCILARYRLEALSTLNKNSIFSSENAKILSPILSLRPKFDWGFNPNSDLQTCNPKSWVQILKQSLAPGFEISSSSSSSCSSSSQFSNAGIYPPTVAIKSNKQQKLDSGKKAGENEASCFALSLEKARWLHFSLLHTSSPITSSCKTF